MIFTKGFTLVGTGPYAVMNQPPELPTFNTMTAALAPVSAVPTTASLLSLFNGESQTGGGRIYLIDKIFVMVVASGPTAPTVLFMVNKALKTTLAGTALSIASTQAGDGNYPATRFAKAVASVTGLTNDGWYPIGNSPSGATGAAGENTEVDVAGAIVLPPGGLLNISAFSSATTASSVQVGVRWVELDPNLGLQQSAVGP